LLRYLPLVTLGALIAEVASLVVVGRWLGILSTLGLLLGALVLGLVIMRKTGLGLAGAMLHRRPWQFEAETNLAAGAFLYFFAAFLLIIPGFVSDVLAILLLIPVFNNWLAGRLAAQFTFIRPGNGETRPNEGPVIDAEAIEIDGGPGGSENNLKRLK